MVELIYIIVLFIIITIIVLTNNEKKEVWHIEIEKDSLEAPFDLEKNEIELIRINKKIQEINKLPHIEVLYYIGHPEIDSRGNFCGRKFILWSENSNLYLLDPTPCHTIGIFGLTLKDIEYFSKSQDAVTMISFKYNGNLETIILSLNAYNFLLAILSERKFTCVEKNRVMLILN